MSDDSSTKPKAKPKAARAYDLKIAPKRQRNALEGIMRERHVQMVLPGDKLKGTKVTNFMGDNDIFQTIFDLQEQIFETATRNINAMKILKKEHKKIKNLNFPETYLTSMEAIWSIFEPKDDKNTTQVEGSTRRKTARSSRSVLVQSVLNQALLHQGHCKMPSIKNYGTTKSHGTHKTRVRQAQAVLPRNLLNTKPHPEPRLAGQLHQRSKVFESSQDTTYHWLFMSFLP